MEEKLQRACMNRDLEGAKELFEKAPQRLKTSLLAKAVAQIWIPFIDYVLSIETIDLNSFSEALHLAAELNQPIILQKMADSGMNMNLKNGIGLNALHTAVKWAKPVCVIVLLHAGGQVAVRDKFGLSVLESAEKLGNMEILKILKDYIKASKKRKQEMFDELFGSKYQTNQQQQEEKEIGQKIHKQQKTEVSNSKKRKEIEPETTVVAEDSNQETKNNDNNKPNKKRK